MNSPNENSIHWHLFGGTGFIGQHLALSVLNAQPGAKVTLLDIRKPDEVRWQPQLDDFIASGQLRFYRCDVRQDIELAHALKPEDILVNLAAVHREPGHAREEYFETNIKGAEHVCQLAEQSGCREIIFTSSISVYGEHGLSVDEHSITAPKTAYGQSKLAAEQIHIAWGNQPGRRLSIIRPGVVFGPGEGGNVSRLLAESLRQQRAIFLKPDMAKAGIYIEELLNLVHWLRQRPINSGEYQLVNGVSAEMLHFNDYGRYLVGAQSFSRKPFVVPVKWLDLALGLLSPAKLLLSTASKFHPERLAKLTRANDIQSSTLKDWGYQYQWPLERALADWMARGL